MKKKIIAIFFIFTAMQLFVSANDINSTLNDYLRTVENHSGDVMVYYKKLYNCEPYEVDMGAAMGINMVNSIIGIENNKCHVKTDYLDCFYPLEESKKLAIVGYKNVKDNLDSMKNGASQEHNQKQMDFMNYVLGVNRLYCKK